MDDTTWLCSFSIFSVDDLLTRYRGNNRYDCMEYYRDHISHHLPTLYPRILLCCEAFATLVFWYARYHRTRCKYGIFVFYTRKNPDTCWLYRDSEYPHRTLDTYMMRLHRKMDLSKTRNSRRKRFFEMSLLICK